MVDKTLTPSPWTTPKDYHVEWVLLKEPDPIHIYIVQALLIFPSLRPLAGILTGLLELCIVFQHYLCTIFWQIMCWKSQIMHKLCELRDIFKCKFLMFQFINKAVKSYF